MSKPVLVVVGATGAVGTVTAEVLGTRDDVWSQIRLVASARSVGQRLSVYGGVHEVLPLERSSFVGADVAVMAVPDDVAAVAAEMARAEGVTVVDCSAAFRTEDGVPLVVPEVNAFRATERPRGIVASPSSPAAAVANVLAPLHSVWGLTHLVVTTLQAASGAGRPGVRRLYAEAEAVAGHRLGRTAGDVRRLVSDLPHDSPFPDPLAYNVVPIVGDIGEDQWTTEEIALREEVRRLLGLPDLKVFATAVQVPVVRSHSMSVHAEFAARLTADDARRALVEGPNSVVVVDDPEVSEWPTPVDTVGADPSFVGRIRQAHGARTSLDLFLCVDNLRKGAALNMLQIAESVVGHRSQDLDES